MKKMVNCKYWKEYQGLSGWIMFCSAGAYAKKFTKTEAEKLGCTEEQRTTCKKIIKMNSGYEVLPEVVEEKQKQEVRQKELVTI